MKTRRHHNNKGHRQIARGKTADSLKRICRKLNLPFKICGTPAAVAGASGQASPAPAEPSTRSAP